jgi:hypothetical protein
VLNIFIAPGIFITVLNIIDSYQCENYSLHHQRRQMTPVLHQWGDFAPAGCIRFHTRHRSADDRQLIDSANMAA